MEMAATFSAIKLIAAGGGAALMAAQMVNMYMKRGKVGKLATAGIKKSEELETLTGDQGLSISKDIKISYKYINEGILVFGPTGAGKTSGFFIPNLLTNDIEGSIIVLDPKGEQYKLTADYQRRVCKRQVIRFAPLDPELSYRYNLLENCKDTTEVSELAATLLNNGALALEIATGKQSSGAEWITMAKPLLTSTLLYVRGLGKPFNTIEYALELITGFNNEELFFLIEYSGNKAAKKQFDIFKTVMKADNTTAGIKITLTSNTELFTDPKINLINAASDFNFKDLRDKKTIIYITYPEHKALYISPFMSCFFTQMLNTLIESYKEGKSLPITMMFDEFANIGMISNMSGYASTVRSREINLNVCLQSITQLEQIYGEKSAHAIINNLKTKIFLPGLSDTKTLKYASELCGSKEIKTGSYSVNPKGEINKSFSYTSRNVLNPDEVRTLKDNDLLIIASNKQPVLSEKNAYFINEEYMKNIRKVDDIVIRKIYSSTKENEEFEKIIREEIFLNYEKLKQENKEEMKKNKNSEKTTKRSSSLADEIFPD